MQVSVNPTHLNLTKNGAYWWEKDKLFELPALYPGYPIGWYRWTRLERNFFDEQA